MYNYVYIIYAFVEILDEPRVYLFESPPQAQKLSIGIKNTIK